jgi:UDP-N-acetylglucosamine:LPS N-acetylglucosamine transferase
MARTILILTSKTGGGHVSIAEAIRDHVKRFDHLATIEILDPQSTFFHWHYRMVSRYALWLWSAEFRLLNSSLRALFAHRIFTQLVAKALLSAIERIRPDIIMTTYPFLTYEVRQILTRNKLKIPFVMIFTDPHSVHASWLTEKDAITLAPTRETYDQALRAGFSATLLHQVGWPVRTQFTQVDTRQRDALLHKIGLHPQNFTIFMQGGGEGSTQFDKTITHILAIHPQLQIILACGTNKTLQARFKHVARVFPLPYTKEIAPFMAAADIIMGKAGPNMLFEAVTLGKPFIATAYIPGQEEPNLEFIRRHKLGWTALTLEQQLSLLSRLVNHTDEVQTMATTVATYRDWNNTQTQHIVTIIEQLFLANILAHKRGLTAAQTK